MAVIPASEMNPLRAYLVVISKSENERVPEQRDT